MLRLTWGHPFWPPRGVCAQVQAPLRSLTYRILRLLSSHFMFGQGIVLNKKTEKQMGCGFQTSHLQHHDRNQESTHLTLWDLFCISDIGKVLTEEAVPELPAGEQAAAPRPLPAPLSLQPESSGQGLTKRHVLTHHLEQAPGAVFPGVVGYRRCSVTSGLCPRHPWRPGSSLELWVQQCGT